MLGYPGHCGTFFRECPQCYYCTDTTLLECSTGRHLNLPGAPIAVGAQCGGTTHLPPATARPHHRCVGDTALAGRPRTRALQDRGANVHSARQRATISGTSCGIAYLPGRRALRSASTSRLVIPPIKLSILLAAVPFRLLQLEFGTVCQRPSSHRHRCSLSGVN